MVRKLCQTFTNRCAVGQVAIWRLAILEALRRSVAYLALLATYVAWSRKIQGLRKDTQPEVVGFVWSPAKLTLDPKMPCNKFLGEIDFW